MGRLMLVCSGGAPDTGARYLASTWFAQRYHAAFALGIVFIDIIGSFLIALITKLSLTTVGALVAGVLGLAAARRVTRLGAEVTR